MKIQFNHYGQFRIIAEDGTKGRWSSYRSLATLEHGGKTYIAGSEYGLLPKAEVVYEFTELPTTLAHDATEEEVKE